MGRYSIAGINPGQTLHTPVGALEAHPADGAFELTDEQKAHLEKNQWTLKPAASTPPKHVPPEQPIDLFAEDLIAANSAAAERANAEATKLTPPVKK